MVRGRGRISKPEEEVWAKNGGGGKGGRRVFVLLGTWLWAETEGQGEWEGQALGGGEWELAEGGSSGLFLCLCGDCEMGTPGTSTTGSSSLGWFWGSEVWGAMEIAKGRGCTDPWLPNHKQRKGSKGSLRKGGSSQGHSPCRPVAAPSLDPGLLTPCGPCATAGGLLGEGGWLDPAQSLVFCLVPPLGLPAWPWAPRPPPSGALFPLAPSSSPISALPTLYTVTCPSHWTIPSSFCFPSPWRRAQDSVCPGTFAKEVRTPVPRPVERRQESVLCSSLGVKL